MFNPNYGAAIKKSVEVLDEFDISRTPTDLNIIFDALSNEIKVYSYSDFMSIAKISLTKTINCFGSDSGICFWDKNSNCFLIYYNDFQQWERCRFTLAHELGHIFMKHYESAHVDKLKRATSSVYEMFEHEANTFARNLLSPALTAYYLTMRRDEWSAIQTLESEFSISKKAAKVRLDKIACDLRFYDLNMRAVDSRILADYRPMCNHCKQFLPEHTKFCPICSSPDITLELFDLNYQNSLFESRNLHICSKCGSKLPEHNVERCIICGTPTKNCCLGDMRHENPKYANYCIECGALTEYGVSCPNNLNKSKDELEHQHIPNIQKLPSYIQSVSILTQKDFMRI